MSLQDAGVLPVTGSNMCLRCLRNPWTKGAMCGLSGLAILTTIAAGVCVMIYGDGGGVDEHFNKFMKGFMKDGLLVIEGSATIPVWTMIPAGVALLGMFPILCGNATSCRKGNAVVLLLISILVAVFMPSILAEILAANAPDAPDAEVQVEVPDDILTDETIIAVSVGGGVSALAGVGGAIVANSGIFSKKSEAVEPKKTNGTKDKEKKGPVVIWEIGQPGAEAAPVAKKGQAGAKAAPVELQEVLSLADNPTNASTSQPEDGGAGETVAQNKTSAPVADSRTTTETEDSTGGTTEPQPGAKAAPVAENKPSAAPTSQQNTTTAPAPVPASPVEPAKPGYEDKPTCGVLVTQDAADDVKEPDGGVHVLVTPGAPGTQDEAEPSTNVAPQAATDGGANVGKKKKKEERPPDSDEGCVDVPCTDCDAKGYNGSFRTPENICRTCAGRTTYVPVRPTLRRLIEDINRA